jgi:hypothetical protein
MGASYNPLDLKILLNATLCDEQISRKLTDTRFYYFPPRYMDSIAGASFQDTETERENLEKLTDDIKAWLSAHKKRHPGSNN